MPKFFASRANAQAVRVTETAPSPEFPTLEVVANWLKALFEEYGGCNPAILPSLTASYFKASEHVMAEGNWRPKTRCDDGKRYISGVPVWRAVFVNAADGAEMSAALWFGHKPDCVDLELALEVLPRRIEYDARVEEFNIWFEA